MEIKRITIVTGFYGTGKSEFSINLAIRARQFYEKVALIDLDIINPYFRSREMEDYLSSQGIKTISSSIKGSAVDLPALSPEIRSPLRNQEYRVILDLGGDKPGIRVMGAFKEYLIEENNYDILYVVNTNRPENSSKEKIIQNIKILEAELGLKITGLVNNTHMLGETSFEDILRGNEISGEVSENLEIPLVCNSVNNKLEAIEEGVLIGELFPMDIKLREKWMS